MSSTLHDPTAHWPRISVTPVLNRDSYSMEFHVDIENGKPLVMRFGMAITQKASVGQVVGLIETFLPELLGKGVAPELAIAEAKRGIIEAIGTKEKMGERDLLLFAAATRANKLIAGFRDDGAVDGEPIPFRSEEDRAFWCLYCDLDAARTRGDTAKMDEVLAQIGEAAAKDGEA